MIKDTFGRVHDYLRISLTESCNLRCTYCMPEEDYEVNPMSKLMSADEIDKFAQIFVGLGVKKIRLTGGEPLVRRDAGEIIDRLSMLPVSLSMTTNGTRLHHFTESIRRASMRSINISLDSLKPRTFKSVTRRDQFNLVWSNIHSMIALGLDVKVNVVVMRGVNDNELLDFVEWTRHTPVKVRFIEFMPFTGNKWDNEKMVPLSEMLERISSRFQCSPLPHLPHETSKRYIVPGHLGSFAFISTMSSHFCGDCNRMRLTADGKLKNCLFSKNETDLLTPLRNGENIEELIHQCIASKADRLGGQFGANAKLVVPDAIENRSMITIGG